MPEKTSVPLKAKCCYGHLGGTLGNRLFDSLLQLGWFQQVEDNPKIFSLTEFGISEFKKLGVDPYERKK